MSQVNSKTSALDLDHQDQISLQTIFVKKLTVFHYTFKLKLCIAHLLVQSIGGESCFCSGYLLGMDHLIPGGVGELWFFFIFHTFSFKSQLNVQFLQTCSNAKIFISQWSSNNFFRHLLHLVFRTTLSVLEMSAHLPELSTVIEITSFFDARSEP